MLPDFIVACCNRRVEVGRFDVNFAVDFQNVRKGCSVDDFVDARRKRADGFVLQSDKHARTCLIDDHVLRDTRLNRACCAHEFNVRVGIGLHVTHVERSRVFGGCVNVGKRDILPDACVADVRRRRDF